MTRMDTRKVGLVAGDTNRPTAIVSMAAKPYGPNDGENQSIRNSL